ncbi:MAG: glycosyltransferase [Thermodesulfobacteriota bacterium]
MRITTAICTRGRSPYLDQAVASVLSQEPPADGISLLIVDDGCPEDVALRLSALSEKDQRLTLGRTGGGGLSRARNHAAAVCGSGILAFVDDDARMAEGYLKRLEEFFMRHEDAAAAGGRVIPEVAGLPPPWFSEGMWAWANGLDLGGSVRVLHYPEIVYGTNMAFRVSALQRAGGFDERFGRTGDGMGDCEEAELFLRMEKLGMAVYYDPGLRIVHTLSADRLTPSYFREKAYAHGRSCALLDRIHGRGSGLFFALAPAAAAAARHLIPPFTASFSRSLAIAHARGYLRQAWSGTT